MLLQKSGLKRKMVSGSFMSKDEVVLQESGLIRKVMFGQGVHLD